MSLVSVTLQGTDTVIRRLDAPELLQPAVHDLLRDAATIGKDAAVKGVRSDTGALVKGFDIQISPLTATLTSTAPHGIYVDQGRRPGAAPPPVAALRGWLSRKGIPAEMAYPIAKAIGRRGIKGRFFMRAGRDAVIHALPRLIARAESTIAREWGR